MRKFLAILMAVFIVISSVVPAFAESAQVMTFAGGSEAAARTWASEQARMSNAQAAKAIMDGFAFTANFSDIMHGLASAGNKSGAGLTDDEFARLQQYYGNSAGARTAEDTEIASKMLVYESQQAAADIVNYNAYLDEACRGAVSNVFGSFVGAATGNAQAASASSDFLKNLPIPYKYNTGYIADEVEENEYGANTYLYHTGDYAEGSIYDNSTDRFFDISDGGTYVDTYEYVTYNETTNTMVIVMEEQAAVVTFDALSAIVSYLEFTNTGLNYAKQCVYYYLLPDGRNSYDLSIEEVWGLDVNYNLINYTKVPEDDGSTLSLYHLDGNFRDSSYYCKGGITSLYSAWTDTLMQQGLGISSVTYTPKTWSMAMDAPASYTLEYRVYPSSSEYYHYATGTDVTKDGQVLQDTVYVDCPVSSEWAIPLVANQWNSVCISRSSSSAKCFINGVSVNFAKVSIDNQGAITVDSTASTISGCSTDTAVFSTAFSNSAGCIINSSYVVYDEIRLSNSVLHSSNYTVSSQPFDTNLVLTVPEQIKNGDLSVYTSYPARKSRCGGVRPTYPENGFVYIKLDDHKIVDTIEQYQDDGWYEITGFIRENNAWVSLEDKDMSNYLLYKDDFPEFLDGSDYSDVGVNIFTREETVTVTVPGDEWESNYTLAVSGFARSSLSSNVTCWDPYYAYCYGVLTFTASSPFYCANYTYAGNFSNRTAAVTALGDGSRFSTVGVKGLYWSGNIGASLGNVYYQTGTSSDSHMCFALSGSDAVIRFVSDHAYSVDDFFVVNDVAYYAPQDSTGTPLAANAFADGSYVTAHITDGVFVVDSVETAADYPGTVETTTTRVVSDAVSTDLTINYKEADTNKIIRKSTVIKGLAAGQTYSFNSPAVSGYTVVLNNQTVDLVDSGNVVTVFYTKNLAASGTDVSGGAASGTDASGGSSSGGGLLDKITGGLVDLGESIINLITTVADAVVGKLLSGIAVIVDSITKFLSSIANLGAPFTAFLGAVLAFLPKEIVDLIIAGLGVSIALAIFKFIRK